MEKSQTLTDKTKIITRAKEWKLKKTNEKRKEGNIERWGKFPQSPKEWWELGGCGGGCLYWNHELSCSWLAGIVPARQAECNVWLAWPHLGLMFGRRTHTHTHTQSVTYAPYYNKNTKSQSAIFSIKVSGWDVCSSHLSLSAIALTTNTCGGSADWPSCSSRMVAWSYNERDFRGARAWDP